MKIVASIECRMTSSRLPGKVLMNALDDYSMLEVMVHRVKKSKLVDEIILATTINEADNAIEELAKKLNIKYYRGSENDVLGRVVKAHQSVNSDLIVELTGDCPLIDPVLIDQCIQVYLDNKYDYVSNNYSRTFPDGSDVQVFPLNILEEADKNTKDPLDREHVSKYLYEGNRYNIYTVEAKDDYYWPSLAVTLDEKDDYELLRNIFHHFGHINFSTREYIEYLKNNMYLLKLNEHIKRKGLT